MKKVSKKREEKLLKNRIERLSAVSEHPEETAKESLESNDELPVFDLKLSENFEVATPVQYVFSQLGYTCAPDALFTLLFEAETIGPVLRELNEGSFEIQLFKNDATLGDSVRALLLALERYRDMKSLETTARGSGSSIVRHTSLNVAKQRGTQISSILQKGHHACPTKATPTEAIHTYVENIVTKNRMGLFGPDQKMKYILGTEIDESDIDKIFACIFVIVKEKKPVGHMMGMFRRSGKWYLVNNELGRLYVAKDAGLITNLFKLMAFGDEDVKYMWDDNWFFMPEFMRVFVHN